MEMFVDKTHYLLLNLYISLECFAFLHCTPSAEEYPQSKLDKCEEICFKFENVHSQSIQADVKIFQK